MPSPFPWNIAFHSGFTADSDLQAALDVGIAIGVVADRVTLRQQLRALPDHLDRGGKVFVDSGAFTAFRRQLPMDWPRVLTLYRALCTTTLRPENLSIVAPDVVGDQQATLLLWHRYARDIRSWIDVGARVIIPLQAGSLSAGELLQEAIGLLGTKAFCAGIPSNLAAMTAADCRTLEHNDFHILGRVVMTDELRDKVEALLTCNAGATISSDANWLRSRTRQIAGAVEMLRGTPNLLQTRRTRAVKALLMQDAFGSLDQLAPR
ncbi:MULTISPECIES: hypothetical protein [unclassified Pseudomonas]|uniref:hypothetical protein n=1 Tax=unclassified Pseudomonas TaxID=196821 RepID=UPI00235F2ABA|nr:MULTISPECIES: hypothetical protein [unclassified Pseudomonas]